MSAARLLILGVLRIKQPIHGYDVRRELETWNAEQWANIAYGSIYFALNKMSEEGFVAVENTEQPGKRPARTVYRITETGEKEFQRLLHEYWWDIKPVIDPFQVALSFMNALPREEILSALQHRLNSLKEVAKFFTDPTLNKSSDPTVPRHIAENLKLAAAHMLAEVSWIQEAIGKVAREELP